jgi:predicted metal-dependent hydrolase
MLQRLRAASSRAARKFYRQLNAAAMKSAEKKKKFELGLEHFNSRKFFEAHEIWEEIWLVETEPEKTFLQGLIQLAAAYHHYEHGNPDGTESLLASGIVKLSRFPEHHHGLSIGELRAAAKQWARLLGQGKTPGSARLPRIESRKVGTSNPSRTR